MATPIAQAVTVSLDELQRGSVSLETLQLAFGPDSLGILVVKDVPPRFHDLRRQVLSFSSYLGNLPQKELAKLENATAKYLTGWSLGKEMLRNGQVDRLKGSFYANCAFYVDPSLGSAAPTGDYTVDNFPEYLSPNVWPDEAVLPGFRTALEELCRLVIDVAVLVARACDRFAAGEIAGYPTGYLENMVKTSTTTKARLLHYFPSEGSTVTDSTAGGDPDGDDWCATHLDHGCLTGLTSAMFVDESGLTPGALPLSPPEPLAEMVTSPDPSAGLYIRSRAGEKVQVKIPRDCLAFQTGEALERITEGKFKAVPHFVKGPAAASASAAGRVARNTLAVFTQPNLGDLIDIRRGVTFGEFARGVVAKNTVG